MLGDYWKDKYLNTELEVSHVYATSGGFLSLLLRPLLFFSYCGFSSQPRGHESRVNTTFKKLCCLYCCRQRVFLNYYFSRSSLPGSIFIEVFDYISHYASVKRIQSKCRRIQSISLGKKSACIETVQKHLNYSRTYKPLGTIMYEA